MIVRLTRRYCFTASHRLHAPQLSAEQNIGIYGKCNNPYGHGHNYAVELTVAGPVDETTGRVVDLAVLDTLAEDHFLSPFRYRYLNEEVPGFRNSVPTTENLTAEVDRRLRAAWSQALPSGPRLESVRIFETERNVCEVTSAAL